MISQLSKFKINDFMTLADAMYHKGRDNNFSAIKIVSACLVVLMHSTHLSGVKKDLFQILTGNQLSFGDIAVQIFFVISGFLVVQSAFRIIQKNFAKKIYLQAFLFFRKRIMRIVPSLTIVVFITSFVIGPVFTTVDLNRYFLDPSPYLYFIKNILLLTTHKIIGLWDNSPLPASTNGSLWTLPVEFLCYIAIFLSIVVGFIKKKDDERSLLMNIGEIIASLFFLFQPIVININPLLVPTLKLFLLYYISSLCYVYRNKIILDVRLFIIFLFCYCFLYTVNLGVYSIIFLPYLVFFIAYLPSQRIGIKLLNFCGKLSYECYLVAWPIQQMIIYFLGGNKSWEVTLITMPLMLVSGFGVNKLSNLLLNFLKKFNKWRL